MNTLYNKLLPFFKLVRFMYTFKCIQFKILRKKWETILPPLQYIFVDTCFEYIKNDHTILYQKLCWKIIKIYIIQFGKRVKKPVLLEESRVVAMRFLICSNRFALLRTSRTEWLLKILVVFYNRVLGNGA